MLYEANPSRPTAGSSRQKHDYIDLLSTGVSHSKKLICLLLL